MDPHSPRSRNSRFNTAANDSWPNVPSDEPGTACSSLLLAVFKIDLYTSCLASSDGFILQTPYLPHPPARRSTVAHCARLAKSEHVRLALDAQYMIWEGGAFAQMGREAT